MSTNLGNANPDFSKFEITSIAKRKMWSKAFLVLCSATSALSIIVLITLISTIIISALPVFGPHEDSLESESRMLFVQGPDGDQEALDSGDSLQGIFRARQFQRGGLDKSNDEVFVDEDGNVSQTTIGFYAFQLNDQLDGRVQQLRPATGDANVTSLLKKLGIETDVAADNAAIVVLTSESASETSDFDFDNLEIDGNLTSPKLLEELTKIDDWSLQLVAGIKTDQDFAELKYSDANNGDLSKLKKTRVRKKAGVLKILASVLFDRTHPIEEYKNIKLRSSATNEIKKGQLKVNEATLKGISRRKRKGFDLAGEFNLVSCVVPEDDASVAKHAAHFLKAKPSDSNAAKAGIGPALWGSIWVCTFCALFALPLGIGTAVFLEEFKPTNRVLRFLQKLIQLNITNLAGVPSIVYGLLGLTAFATMFGQFGSSKEPEYQIGAEHFFQYLSEAGEPVLVRIDSPTVIPTLVDGMDGSDSDYQPIKLKIIAPGDPVPDDPQELKRTLRSDSQGGYVSERPWYYFQLPLGRGVLAASLTLMLVILPVIIISSQEAIKAVPMSLRQGAMGLGATRWQVVRRVTLPAAIPGIMTGAILSISRAIGEAAPIIILCGTVFIAAAPQHLMDFYSVLPIQIFYITGLTISEDDSINFQNVAAAASLVLLIVLLTFNTIAIVLRQLTSKPLS